MEKYWDWFKGQSDVLGLLIVGSHARGDQNEQSDLDIMILSDDYEKYLVQQDWIFNFGNFKSAKDEDWGAVKTVRVFFDNGDEVEFNFSDRLWTKIDPVDEGTRKVMSNGFKIVHDPYSLLSNLSKEIYPT